MSSWSGSHPPPPRGERSRSPSRGAYGRPAYPDPPYAAEPYRSDWDHYSRERAWADWERDKTAYDYGRRPRSRSPPYDDLGRKRRRSMSPYDRERYEPRPRYDDYEGYRGYGHSPPRGRGQYGHGYGSRPSRAPVDPHTLDYPANLKQYAEWFRYYYPQQAAEEDAADKSAEQEAGDGSKPRNGLKTKWEKYKKDFLAQQLQTLFDHHRKSPWFAEKYDPSTEFANVRSRVRKIGWRGRMNQFVNELEDGKFDSSFNENEPEPSSPVKEGSSVPENGAADDTVKNEEEFGMGLEGEEEAADNAGDIKTDANGKSTFDAKRPGKDEVSVMPEGNQVMIRTIPPDIGRMKLETAIKDMPGFVYLALGDPMQKRNYYRAGWIKFTEEVDMHKVITVLGEKKVGG
ncbi:hypothetical protein DFH11DRAFT_1555368 [Phellopilus nigrolimitatus]|nr:hypothetical protein DFH11DRAFT_1555368 [Phellopilus nigrolimitatus]